MDQNCVIGNTGSMPLIITGLTAGGCGFSVVSPTPTAAAPLSPLLNGQYTQVITMSFSPCGVGAQPGLLTITSNASPSTFTVGLSGGAPGSISLAQGWNLISLAGEPASTDPGTLLANISPNVCNTSPSVAVVWGYSAGAKQPWSFYVPGGTGNTLTAMTAGNGYWIYMNCGPATLPFD